jgi:hypothetical protein
MNAPRARSRRRWLWWLLIPGLYAAVMIAFQPLVTWETRRILALFEGYRSTFNGCWLHPFSLTYHIKEIRIVKESAGGAEEPFLSLESFELSVDWRELWRGHLVAKVSLDRPAVHLIAANSKSERQTDPEIPDLGPKLAKVLPLKVQRISVTAGEVTFVDKTKREFPRLVLDHLEATVENFATRAALAKGEPTIVAVAGKVQKAATLSIYVTLDPLAKGLFFSGQFRLDDLPLADLRELLASETGVRFDKGTIDVFAEFVCRDGIVKGGIKPLLKNAHLVQGKPGLINLLKAELGDAAIDIASDRVPGRNAVATSIPIAGRVTNPKVQVWPAVVGVLRNAFVDGVSESFARLPPPEDSKDKSGIQQLVEGLDRGKAAPKAQPVTK